MAHGESSCVASSHERLSLRKSILISFTTRSGQTNDSPALRLNFFRTARMRAYSFGWKLRACIASIIRLAVSGDTVAAPVSKRDTLAVETEAVLATSRIPMLDLDLSIKTRFPIFPI